MAYSSYGIVSLGCPKNLVDSENLLTYLAQHGGKIEAPEKAQTVIINTCSFIDPAVKEACETIQNFLKRKEQGKLRNLIVTGCLVSRFGKEFINKNFKGIDLILEDKESLAKLFKLSPTARPSCISLTPPHFAYVKIAEGCSRTCSFCTIPQIRGPYRSYPIDEILEQAKNLIYSGVKELILVAQDLTLYGYDLYHKFRLTELLEKLCKIDGIPWIRLLYLYPSERVTELIEFVKDNPKIVRYLEIPIQHAADRILKKMKRGTRRELESIISKLRIELPELYLRTEVIVGFPSESEEDFNELLIFLSDYHFERIGIFPFYREVGTKAFNFSEQLEPEIIEERVDTLRIIADSLMEKAQQKLVGKTISVIVDKKVNGCFYGRTPYDSPEVDLEVILPPKVGIKIGELGKIKIVGIKDLDLVGSKS